MFLGTTGISKSFGGNQVLKDISLGFEAGQIHALLGENGAGKSTLMKILAGIYQADSGTITFEGARASWKNPSQAQRAGISLIPQELNLAGHLTVAENIFLGTESSGWALLKDRQAINATVQLIRDYGLDFDARYRVSRLSPSQKQQVEILRALVRAQKVLILDEPTAYFSDRENEALFRMMRQLRERGLCLIFITHRLEELEGLVDWVTVLRDGACVLSADYAQTTVPEILSMMVGGNIERIFPEKTRVPAESCLELRHVSLPGQLHDVSFDVRRGEIFGLGGFVGSRRTTVAELLFGLHPRYSGEVLVDEKPVRLQSPQQAMQLGIAFVSEDRKATGVFPHLSVTQNLSLLSIDRCSGRLLISESREQEIAGRMAAQLKIRGSGLDRPISRLSGGNQQKAILGRWLLTQPRILVLDEPTRGIDMGARIELYAWFDRLAREGYPILMISSDLYELEGLCDRVAVFREGRLVRILEGADIRRGNVVQFAALG